MLGGTQPKNAADVEIGQKEGAFRHWLPAPLRAAVQSFSGYIESTAVAPGSRLNDPGLDVADQGLLRISRLLDCKRNLVALTVRREGGQHERRLAVVHSASNINQQSDEDRSHLQKV